MNAFIVFDVSVKSGEVKNGLIVKGYWPSWSSPETRKSFHLPVNCLWKPNIELAQAKIDIQNVISTLNLLTPNAPPIILLRCITLSVNPWDGFEGQPA